jgi:hypothetical protein
VSPAGDLDERAALVEVVEDGVRVGDEVALVSVEQTVDRGRVVLGGVLEEHVPLGRDDDPEVAASAFLAGASLSDSRSRFCPTIPSSSLRQSSSVCMYSLRYSSRSAETASRRALNSVSLASIEAAALSVTATRFRNHAAIDPSSGYASLHLLLCARE